MGRVIVSERYHITLAIITIVETMFIYTHCKCLIHCDNLELLDVCYARIYSILVITYILVE
jgi:hypothetical protein